jgi:ATP-binding cassette subfamily G (WHITE) protein 2
MTGLQRKRRVDGVIETLGLYRCADTKVGTEFLRGVSGGERKRTNIGMELIIEPQVLFLDEPTTGLDAHTAVSVVSQLKDLSVNDNRLVVLSIHQPRYSIFKLFDSLSLLSQGEIVYHGQASMALDYFDQLGFTCEEHENPADFFLDVIFKYEAQCHQQTQATNMLYHVSDEEYSGDCVVPAKKNSQSMKLLDSYHKSIQYQDLRKRIDPVLGNMHEERKHEGRASRIADKVFGKQMYATTFLWQFLMLTLRSAKNLWRSPTLSIFQVNIF